MQRRKFLLISGSLGGFSLVACAHQILQPVTSKNPPESAVKQAQKAKKVKIIVIINPIWSSVVATWWRDKKAA